MKSSKNPEKETIAWKELCDEQKSFVVRVLHWFHFRPNQVARYWMREEVLTWELLQCLRILPRNVFLASLLQRIGASAVSVELVAERLQSDLRNIVVEEYPRFKSGSNQASVVS